MPPLGDDGDVNREAGGERREVGARVRGIPDGGVEQPIHADEIERRRRREQDHRRRRGEGNGVQPAVLAQQRRWCREIEDGEGNDGKCQRSRQPGENRQRTIEPRRQHSFDAEQRPAAADRTQRERDHRELRGQIAAAQQEQHEPGDREDDDLHDHARTTARRRPRGA